MLFWIFATAIFAGLFLITLHHWKAATARAEELEKDNRDLDRQNLSQEIQLKNYGLALDAAHQALDEEREATREARREQLRLTWLKNHGQDEIEKITREIEGKRY